MTNSKPKSAARLMAKAARMAGFDMAAGWPAELSDVSLACLLAEVEICRHDNDGDVWLDMIDAGVKSGSLSVTRRTELDSSSCVISVRGGWNHLTRQAVADWLKAIDETPGEPARAWLGDCWADEAEGAGGPAQAKTGGRPKGQQGEQLQKIIDALAAWAKTKGESFDSNSMPGQVGKAGADGSFHWLCAKLYPSDFTKGERAFKGYRAGRCTFPPYAKESDFYSRAIADIAQSLGVSLHVTQIKQASRKAA